MAPPAVMEAAPLFSPPDLPAIAGASAHWFAGLGGVRLRAALFPASDPIGSVVVSTGRAEFIEKYLETIGELVGRGFTVLAHDWRGQGLSRRLHADPVLGAADGFDDFVADHGLLLDAFQERLPKPWIALSHSMGGCLTLMALARGEDRFAGCLLSAPMVGLRVGRNRLAPVAALAMARLGYAARYVENHRPAPGAEAFAGNVLTHDRTRFQRTQALIRAHPELALGGVSWGWAASAFAAIAWLRRAPQVARLTLPVVAVTAELEALVDNAAVETLIRRLPNGRRVSIQGAGHELLMEIDDIRAAFLAEFDALAKSVATAQALG